MDLYRDQLLKPYTSVVECDFDPYFDQQINELEGLAERNAHNVQQIRLDEITPPSSSDNGNEEPPPPIPGLLSSTFIDALLCGPAPLTFYH